MLMPVLGMVAPRSSPSLSNCGVVAALLIVGLGAGSVLGGAPCGVVGCLGGGGGGGVGAGASARSPQAADMTEATSGWYLAATAATAPGTFDLTAWSHSGWAASAILDS